MKHLWPLITDPKASKIICLTYVRLIVKHLLFLMTLTPVNFYVLPLLKPLSSQLFRVLGPLNAEAYVKALSAFKFLANPMCFNGECESIVDL
jgi:hypothetical protein